MPILNDRGTSQRFNEGIDMVSAIERQILQSKVIERIQQVQQQHPDLQQQYFEVHLSKERRRMNKKINESVEMYHIDLSEEGKKDQKERSLLNCPQNAPTAAAKSKKTKMVLLCVASIRIASAS